MQLSSTKTIKVMKELHALTGLGDDGGHVHPNLQPRVHPEGPQLSDAAGKVEAKESMTGAVDELLQKTGGRIQ